MKSLHKILTFILFVYIIVIESIKPFVFTKTSHLMLSHILANISSLLYATVYISYNNLLKTKLIFK